MKLAILVPTLGSRLRLKLRMMTELHKQIASLRTSTDEVTVLFKEDNGEQTTGVKRNALIQEAIIMEAEYIAFHDDDDLPGSTYIKRGLEVVESGMDCGELVGQIFFDGKPGMPFHHYLGCTHAWQDEKKYHRPPNHLNFMKLDLIKDFKFEDKSFGEDMCFAMELQKAGVFKTMYPIKEVIYSYFVGSPKHPL
jgi:hypothetical protein